MAGVFFRFLSPYAELPKHPAGVGRGITVHQVRRPRFPFPLRKPCSPHVTQPPSRNLSTLPHSAEGSLEAQRHQDPESSAGIYAPFPIGSAQAFPEEQGKSQKRGNQVPRPSLLSSRVSCRGSSVLPFPGPSSRAPLQAQPPPWIPTLQRGSAKPALKTAGASNAEMFPILRTCNPAFPFSGRFTGRGASFLPFVLGGRHGVERGKLRRPAGLMHRSLEIPGFLLPPFPFS